MPDSTQYRFILDNQHKTVAEYLRKHLPASDVLRLVSAYFSIYGYETLQNELTELEDVRFLFGDPGSVGELDPGEKVLKAFDLTESGLSPSHALQQKFLAKQCAEWVGNDHVKIRSVAQSNFLHGKMYLVNNNDGSNAVVGSSNFTRRGRIPNRKFLLRGLNSYQSGNTVSITMEFPCQVSRQSLKTA